MTQTKQNNVLPIIMMFALFAMISFVTNLASPFAAIVKDQFHATDFMAQLGNAANFIAYAFMGIPAGIMLKRLGYKRTALIAVGVGFLGVGIMFLSGVAESFSIYLSGAFVAGFSMCMLNTVVNPMLNTLGGGGKKGNQLVQFGGSVNSLSGTIAPILVGMLTGTAAKASIEDANPALFIAMGIFAVVFLVLLAVRIPEPHLEKKDTSAVKIKDKYSPWSFRHFTLGAIAIFVYVGVEVGIPAFIITFLSGGVENGGLGMSKAVAGSVAGIYWLLMMFGRIFGGIIATKVSPRAMLGVVAALACSLISAGIILPDTIMVSMPTVTSDLAFASASVPLSVLLFVLVGLCTSVMWGGIFNLAVEGLGKKYTAMASGFFMVMVCGGGILPLIQGAIVDHTASYMAGYWVIVAGCAYMLFYALVGSKNVNKDIPVD